MTKKTFAIIGKPLTHSLSPTLHGYWNKKYKFDASYQLLEIEEEEIKDVINKIKQKKIAGVNVTLPYKQKVIPYLDKLINDAQKCKSVNTIYLNSEGLIVGDNTDVYGFQAGYLREITDINPNRNKSLIIGAGGVSPSVIFALVKSNINDITVVNRTQEKLLFLKKEFPEIKIMNWQNLEEEIKTYDIIINATSLGLKNNNDFEFMFKNFKKTMIYIDIIYNPLKTKMMKHLEASNVKTYNGLDMFIYQGQKSFYLWNKVNPEIDDGLVELLNSKLK